MIYFILFFLLVLIVSSIFINGFFLITGGEWVRRYDDKLVWKGKIFSFYQKFLLKYTIERMPYKGKEWVRRWLKIKNYFKDEEIINLTDGGVEVKALSKKRIFNLYAYAEAAGVNVTVQEVKNEGSGYVNNFVMVFEEVRRYKYPLWLTSAIGTCITCMSSVFGTILFLFWNRLANEFIDYNYIEIYVIQPFWIKGLTWILFCISLAYLNELFFNINFKLKRNAKES